MKVHLNNDFHEVTLCGKEYLYRNRHHKYTPLWAINGPLSYWVTHPDEHCSVCAELLDLAILKNINI